MTRFLTQRRVFVARPAAVPGGDWSVSNGSDEQLSNLLQQVTGPRHELHRDRQQQQSRQVELTQPGGLARAQSQSRRILQRDRGREVAVASLNAPPLGAGGLFTSPPSIPCDESSSRPALVAARTAVQRYGRHRRAGFQQLR